MVNPFANIKRKTPPQRKVVWTEEHVRQFLDRAYGLWGSRSIGLIVHMAYEWCQRLGDMRLLKSDRVAEKMLTLYNQEAATRGQNAWALYSAFTNYASYADERNGFGLRNTGKDTNAITMFRRENQAAQWVNSKEFKELLAA